MEINEAIISGASRTFKLDAGKLYNSDTIGTLIGAGVCVGFCPTDVPCTISVLKDVNGNDIRAKLGFGTSVGGSPQTAILENFVSLLKYEKGIGQLQASTEVILLLTDNK